MYNRELISVSLKQVMYRSVGSESFKYLNTLSNNIAYIREFLLVVIIECIIYVCIDYSTNNKKGNLINALPYFLISIIPFVWIFLIRDHSFKHSFFTYRILILTIIGLPLGIYYFLKDNNKINEK